MSSPAHPGLLSDSLIDNIGSLVVVFDAQGNLVRFNRACRRLTGFEEEELAGNSRFWEELLLPDERRGVEAVFHSLVRGISPIHHENHLCPRDGEPRLVAWENTVVKDQAGAVCLVIGTGQDITDQRWVQSQLESSERRFRDLFQHSPDPCWIIDGNRFVECNEAAVRMLGYPDKVKLLNTHPAALSPKFQPDGEASEFKAERMIALARENGLHRFEWVHSRADGTHFDAEVTLSRLSLQGRDMIHCVWRDISDRKRAEEGLKLAGTVFTNSSEGILVTDAKTRIMSVNPAFTEITGYSAEEVVGRTPRILKSDHHEREFYAELWDQLSRTGRWQGEVWNRRKDGSAFIQWQTISAVKSAEGRLVNYVSVFTDITEMRRNEDRIRHLAYHDALTGLANRTLMLDRLNHGIGVSGRKGQKLAVMFLDLDRFKAVNDTLGHDVGDQLLRDAAERIMGRVRRTDTVARMGGDEFVIILEPAGSFEDVARVADEIGKALTIEVTRGGEQITVTSSIGIALFPDNGADSATLLKQADTAMYAAKAEGRNTYRFFNDDMTASTLARLRLERDLRDAIAKGEFELHYQPKVCLTDGVPCGFEALIRWRKDGALVSPAAFIPVAEETGLIVALGEWVLAEVCRQIARWKREGVSHGPVSINVSPQQLAQGDFAMKVAEYARKCDISPSVLQIEVTESALMSDPQTAANVLGSLRALGATIAIDDFGTGYSSLAYLTKLPIDVIKIDRSFIFGLAEGQESFEIVNSIVALGRALNMSVVAEGVETTEQVDQLMRAACGVGQGYLFAKPMPDGAVCEWLKGQKSCAECNEPSQFCAERRLMEGEG